MDNNLTDQQQINLTMSNITNDTTTTTPWENGLQMENNNDNFGFSNLPYSEPIDLQFKDITYTANLGFNKGK